jgi:hypothetical protein
MSNSRPLAYDRVNLFGPIAINLLAAGDADLLVLNDQDTKFFPTSIVDRLKHSEQLARANGKSGVADLFRDAMNEIVSMKQAAAKVVNAMNHQGEDGWERLKAAVVDLSRFTD